jgi:OmpA-OmpF porin, OOP family
LFLILKEGNYMRKVALGLALATTALSAPAMARDGQWYAGIEGGLLIAEDTDLDITTTQPVATVEGAVQINNNNPGYDFDGIVGYDFGGFRTEAEVAYKAVQHDGLVARAPGVPGGVGMGTSLGALNTNGQTDALSFMVNGLLDFGDDDGLQGFVGAGIGVARVEVTSTLASPSWLDDSDTGLAWQALAGVRAPISDNWDVGLKYRYFNASGMEFVDTRNRAVETDFKSHSLLGSLIYNFGGAPVAPVVVAPPVVIAPPKPPMVTPPKPPVIAKPVCNTAPYIVYFDHDKSNLRPDAATVLDAAAANYANCGNARVMLAGHADRSGNATYNVGLSNRRNDTVRGYLTTKGVPSGALSAQGFGEGQNRVPTADGVREPQNRRVEVVYGPGSGM